MSTNSDPNRVVIFDTTLRDGEQSPGASMNLEEKLQIALVLEEMGVDVIEAGFPISSNGDFEAVHEIAKVVTDSTVCGLSRATRGDIELTAQAIEPAKRRRMNDPIPIALELAAISGLGLVEPSSPRRWIERCVRCEFRPTHHSAMQRSIDSMIRDSSGAG